MKFLVINLIAFTAYCRNYVSDDDSEASDSVLGPAFAFFFGFALIVSAFPCLWFNERRLAISSVRLMSAKRQCKSVNCLEVDPRMENQLIHIKGKLQTNDTIIDNKFDFKVQHSVKLRRSVETYQWVQKSREEGTKNNKRTVYYYEAEWCKTFKGSYPNHENYQQDFTVADQENFAQNVYLGAYKLTDYLINKANDYQPVYPTQENIIAAQQRYIPRTQPFIFQDGKFIYFRKYENQLTTGDQRIWFDNVPCSFAAIVARQHGESFKPFLFNDQYSEDVNQDYAKNPDMLKSMNKFHQLNEEEQPLNQIDPSQEISSNFFRKWEAPINYINWYFNRSFTLSQCFDKQLRDLESTVQLCRLGGFLMFLFGFVLLFSPITTLTYYLPLIGGFISTLTGYIMFFLSGFLSLPLALGTIGCAWLYYRPIKGLLYLSAAAIAGFGCYSYIQQ